MIYLRPNTLKLLRLVIERPPMNAYEACAAFGISEKRHSHTIASQLTYLERLGLIDRDIYGNAIPNDRGRARLVEKRKPSRMRKSPT